MNRDLPRYRVRIRRRMFTAASYAGLMALLIVVLLVLRRPSEASWYFALGLATGLLVGALRLAILYRRALGDDVRLEALYLEEHDERLQQIQARVGQIGFRLTFLGLATAAIVARFFEPQLSSTLFYIALAMAVMKLVLERYVSQRS